MFPLIDKRETGINLRRIMDDHGVTVKEVQEYLGLGCVQSVYRWLDGISMPTVDNLYALSQLFQMPIDEMVCGNRAPIIAVAQLPIDINPDRSVACCNDVCQKRAA